jgi:putative RecB family exonuclease
MDPKLVLGVYEAVWEEKESQAWQQEPNPAGWQRSGVKKTETDLRDRKIKGRDQVLTYIENTVKERLRPWTLPDTGWVASEVPFEEDFGGVLVKGFIDLVMQDPDTGALLVRDLKTGAKAPVGPIQLKTYSMAMKKKYGVDIAWGDHWMCKDEGPSSPQYLAGIPDVLITSQYQIMDAAVSEEMFAANLGDHCSRCDVAKHCPFVGGTPPEGIHMLGT